MIRPIDIKLNAAHPELPLVEATTFTGAPSSVFVRGVPKSCGNWSITAVNVAVTYPDNTTTTRAAVESAEGVWVATIPGTATSGRTTAGFRILADGIDENGAAVTGYVLGFADFSVLSFTPVPAPGGTFWLLRYFDTMPTTPKKGDVAVVGGILKYYNGTTWLPFGIDDYSQLSNKPQINGVTLSGNKTAADLGLATKADATLTERGPNKDGFSEWNIPHTPLTAEQKAAFYAESPFAASGDYRVKIEEFAGVSYLYVGGYVAATVVISEDGLKATFDSSQSQEATTIWGPNGTTVATRTALPGYVLGSQSDKPLASEAEAEALRTGKADKPATFTTGNLAALDADGNPTDSGVKPSDKLDSTSAAPAFSSDSSTQYAVGAHVTYNGKLYRCTTATTGGTWDSSCWDLAALPKLPAVITPGNLVSFGYGTVLTDSGIAAGDLLTIVTLSDSTETMASILARLNTINAAHKHVFFDCSGIDVNPRLYLCTIMIDADANAVRVYDQVTGKLYIGPYDATETIGEVFAKAVDAYHSITVSAVTLDGVTVTGQTVTIREGTDATAPVYATATITDGAPAVFVVPKGMIYFLEITDTLADHFGPRVTSGAKQGIATADAAVTFTYYDAEHIDTSEITTFAKLQEALTWFGTNESAARNNLVGVEIADTWTATNGTVYDNPRVVWDVHYFEDEDGVSHLGALMGTKYCSHNDVQFDAAEGEECDSATETTAGADVYYYGLALGETSKTAANLTLLELSTGTALPYADYAKIYKSAIRDTARNSLQYGYNNWRDSAYRQYLNSDAAAGQWWGATHIGDIAPSQLNSVRGFMAGCSAALLAAAKKVKVATWPNSITDGPNQITTLYETLDTFFLPSGSEVYGDVNRSGGASVEGALSPYWQARTGYTSPNNTAISTRIIYRELPVGSTANRSAAYVRLRSAYRGYSHGVWFVTTSGQVNLSYADGAVASVPACVIY